MIKNGSKYALDQPTNPTRKEKDNEKENLFRKIVVGKGLKKTTNISKPRVCEKRVR